MTSRQLNVPGGSIGRSPAETERQWHRFETVVQQLAKIMWIGRFAGVVLVVMGAFPTLAHAAELQADTRTTVARSAIGMSVRRGAQKPDLRTIEALKYSVMMAAVGAKSPHPAEGRELIDFLMSRELDAVVRKRGMERAPW